MFAFIYQGFLLLTEASKGGGFLETYNEYFNIPGFELWKFINLAIFIAIMVYLLKKPLGEGFKAKREQIRAELIKAEQEKQAAMQRLSAADSKLTDLDNERSAVLAAAEKEAAAEAERLKREAEAEVERLRNQSGGEMNRLAQQKRAELRKFSAEESIRLAEQKIRAEINTEKDSQLVRSSIRSFGGLN
jgi:F0F1-type ATP synthase membrane subunit b/b'